MIRADLDLDVFMSEVFQVRNELSGLSNVVSNERLTTIILDALPEEKYLTTPILSTCPLHTNSGYGKERRIIIGPW